MKRLILLILATVMLNGCLVSTLSTVAVWAPEIIEFHKEVIKQTPEEVDKKEP